MAGSSLRFLWDVARGDVRIDPNGKQFILRDGQGGGVSYSFPISQGWSLTNRLCLCLR